jgi:hypothetical protein
LTLIGWRLLAHPRLDVDFMMMNVVFTSFSVRLLVCFCIESLFFYVFIYPVVWGDGPILSSQNKSPIQRVAHDDVSFQSHLKPGEAE